MSLRLENPHALWALLLVISLGVMMVRQGLRFPQSFSRRRVAYLLGAFFFCVLGFTRPQGGTRVSATQSVKSNLFFAIDVSQSMLAEDVPPSRLKFAVAFAGKLVERIPGARVALFPFAADGYLQVPLTSDMPALTDVMTSLSPTQISNQGTDLTASLATLLTDISRAEKSAESRGERGIPNQVVLFSDGESHHPLEEGVLRAFRTKRIPVFTVAVGTAGGAPIPMETRFGEASRLRDREGRQVMTQLHPETLARIAEATRGDSYGSRFEDVDRMAQRLNQAIAIGKLTSHFKVEQEYYPALFLIALVMFLLEFAGNGWEYALRSVSLTLIATALVSPLLPRLGFADEVDIRPSAEDERRAIESYNAGVGALGKDLTRAADRFQEAASLTQNGKVKKKALFNLGNALLKSGQAQPAIDAYQEALDVRTDDAKLDREANERISDNLVLASRVLKQQQQQQQQGKGQPSPDDQNGKPRNPQDPKGARKDYQPELFSREQKQKIFDLMASQEQQTMQRVQDERNRQKGGSPHSRNEKPW